MRLLARYSTHLIALAAVPLLLLTRWAIAGQVWGVRVDLLYWQEAGGGFVPLPFALTSLGAAAVIAIHFLVQAKRARKHRVLWLAVAACSVLPAAGMQRSPSRAEMAAATQAGARLVAAIERYHEDEGVYPDSLAQLEGWGEYVPPTGLAVPRSWQYHTPNAAPSPRQHPLKEVAPTRDSYLLTLNLMPQGTLVYRPSERYGSLPGRRLSSGWFCTTVD